MVFRKGILNRFESWGANKGRREAHNSKTRLQNILYSSKYLNITKL